MFLRLQISQVGGRTNQPTSIVDDLKSVAADLIHNGATGAIRVATFLAATSTPVKAGLLSLGIRSSRNLNIATYLGSVALNVASAQILGNRVPQSSSTTGHPLTAAVTTIASDSLLYGAYKLGHFVFDRNKLMGAMVLFGTLAGVVVSSGSFSSHVAAEIDTLLGVQNPQRHLSEENQSRNGMMNLFGAAALLLP